MEYNDDRFILYKYTMIIDYLSKQGARSSVAIAMDWFSRNTTISVP